MGYHYECGRYTDIRAKHTRKGLKQKKEKNGPISRSDLIACLLERSPIEIAGVKVRVRCVISSQLS